MATLTGPPADRSTEFYDIMDMIDKRLNDKGKNWRHVLKALKVLDYCLHEGSELVVTWSRQSIYIIKTLREFQYIDEDGRDVGQNGKFPSSLLRRDCSLSRHSRSVRLTPFSSGGCQRAHVIDPRRRTTARRT